jgi:integrase
MCYLITNAADMRAKAIFTDKSLKALKADSYFLDVFDRSLGGFGVRVSRTGKKRFFVLYREPGPGPARSRKTKRHQLGTYGSPPDIGLAAARQAAREILAAVAEQRAPKAAPPPPRALVAAGPTWGSLVDRYLRERSAHKKDGGAVDRRMLASLPDGWTPRPLSSFTKIEMREFIGPLRAKSPVGSNRVQAFLSAVWNYGQREDLATFNPWIGIDMFDERKHRERNGTTRALKLPEIKTFLNGAGDDIGARVAKCILYTAQRPGEVMGMAWDELDGEWWTIPKERTKNSRETRVYLTQEVRAMIGTRQGNTPHVFPAKDTKRKSTGHLNSIFFQLNAIITRLEMAPFRPHDLRRTATTHMARIDIDDEVREEILNHKSTILKATYNLYRFDSQKQDALTRWASELHRIATL